MRPLLPCALAALLAGPAFAQDAAGCAGLPADSVEAALLGCDDAAPAPAEAPDGDLVGAFTDWYRRHPIGSTVAPSQARLLDAPEAANLPALARGERYVEFDGMVVRVDADWRLQGIARRAFPATAEARAPEPAPAPTPAAEEDRPDQGEEDEPEDGDREDEDRSGGSPEALTAEEARARGIRIPNGHLPPPGACRVWFPGEPPGQQPPPGPCDGEVPPGAVLIRR